MLPEHIVQESASQEPLMSTNRPQLIALSNLGIGILFGEGVSKQVERQFNVQIRMLDRQQESHCTRRVEIRRDCRRIKKGTTYEAASKLISLVNNIAIKKPRNENYYEAAKML